MNSCRLSFASCSGAAFMAPSYFFFFNDTATTEIYTLSLHDALPIFVSLSHARAAEKHPSQSLLPRVRSEEHTSELQSRFDLVCRLLLEKKKQSCGEPPDGYNTEYEVGTAPSKLYSV